MELNFRVDPETSEVTFFYTRTVVDEWDFETYRPVAKVWWIHRESMM